MEAINKIYFTTYATTLDVTFHTLMGRELKPKEVIDRETYNNYCSNEGKKKLLFIEKLQFPELVFAVKSVILMNRIYDDVMTKRGKLYYQGREKADFEGYIDTPFVSYKTSDFIPTKDGYQYLYDHRCYMDYSMPW